MTRDAGAAIALAASIGAGLIHFALGPEHLAELGTLGWGFYVAGVLQLGWAVAVLSAFAVESHRDRANGTRLPRIIGFAGVAMNLGILGAWVVSRTIGTPAGETPWVPESVGRADLISGALELAIVSIVTVTLRAGRTLRPGMDARRRGVLRIAAGLSMAAIVAGTAVGLAPDPAHAAVHEDAQVSHPHQLMSAEQPTR